MNYVECWISSATALFAQALAGEPQLVDSLPRPLEASFAFAATISGDEEGRFTVILDGDLLEAPLLGEGVDQQAAWSELLREVADAAVGDLLARTGEKCRIEAFVESAGENKITHAFQLKSADRAWTILVRDEVGKAQPARAAAETQPADRRAADAPERAGFLSLGLELLLDVELEATLRFGCRELPLGEILEMGSGDVVQLDRHISDPADLIVGDKIVARGEVVLVNGNFGLRVTEIAAPRNRLESIRCLF